ncbi:hypothetical protein QJS04_geneDACA015942 [Acorus gramineus]|uniref:50S ribosomal protein 6, chloroplastic n=1 Tax=Acorus gramineus TaxID=55184 RepID=A0AAV9BGN8_ACOGR|nr:hypothetical protein QJS04_geneDACA015942 [Acorus gramineus]
MSSLSAAAATLKSTIVNSRRTSTPPAKSMVVECSSRPQKKATAHHMKTRPKKSQPWDIRRKPAVYPPLPPLPSDWSLLSEDESASESAVVVPEAEQPVVVSTA